MDCLCGLFGIPFFEPDRSIYLRLQWIKLNVLFLLWAIEFGFSLNFFCVCARVSIFIEPIAVLCCYSKKCVQTIGDQIRLNFNRFKVHWIEQFMAYSKYWCTVYSVPLNSCSAKNDAKVSKITNWHYVYSIHRAQPKISYWIQLKSTDNNCDHWIIIMDSEFKMQLTSNLSSSDNW